MRKFKIILALIIVAAAALFFFQNKDYFLARQALSFTVPMLEPYHLPETNNAILFAAAFVIGLLIAYFFSLLERFKARRTEKNLNATIAAQMESISALKREVEALSGTSGSGITEGEKTASSQQAAPKDVETTAGGKSPDESPHDDPTQEKKIN